VVLKLPGNARWVVPVNCVRWLRRIKLRNNESTQVNIMRKKDLYTVGCLASAIFVCLACFIGAALTIVVVVRNEARKVNAVRMEKAEQEAAKIAKQQEEAVVKLGEAEQLRRRAAMKERDRIQKEKDEQRKREELKMEVVKANELARRVKEDEERQREIARDKELSNAESALTSNKLQIFRALTNLQKRFVASQKNKPHGSLVLPQGELNNGQLSWRVHLLPHIGFEALYEQFALDEPWDSPSNLALLTQMPNFYGNRKDGFTQIRVLLNVDGQRAPYVKRNQIIDGFHHTALFWTCHAKNAVEWTRPDDLELAADSVTRTLGWDLPIDLPIGDSTPVTKADMQRLQQLGRTMFFTNGVSEEVFEWTPENDESVLNSFATHARGEVLFSASSDDPRRLDCVYVPEAWTSAIVDAKLEQGEARLRLVRISKAIKDWIAARQKPNGEKLAEVSDGLSWRVHILPFLKETALYKEFNLQEPWYSAENLPLISRIPKIFQYQSSPGRTRFVVPFARGDDIDANPLSVIRKATDDPELTLFSFWTAPQQAIPWTQPEKVAIDSTGLRRQLGWDEQDDIVAGFADGTSQVLPADLHQTIIKALLSREGKESFNLKTALAASSKPLQLAPTIAAAEPIANVVKLPDVGPMKENVDSSESTDDHRLRMHKVSVAIHNYYSAFRKSPTNVATSSEEPSQLSWRVHLLPTLGEQSAYERFALDEPWDSDTNKAAAANIPLVFQSASGTKGKTDLCIISGQKSLLGGKGDWMRDCTDSLENTIMLVRVGSAREVPWTKPADISLDGLQVNGLSAGASPIPLMMADVSFVLYSKQLGDVPFQGVRSA
jgi:Protein of unknown function (DUF1559)